jgi:hypothetical protein
MKIPATTCLLTYLLSITPVQAQHGPPGPAKPAPEALPTPLADTVPAEETGQKIEIVAGESVVYTNNDVSFSFTYPAELHAESAESLAARLKKATDRSDPKFKETDACMHILLRAERMDEPNKSSGTIAFYGEGHSPQTKLTFFVTGSVTITEVMNQRCIPAEYKGHEDEILSGLAGTVDKDPGAKLIDQPIWYEVDSHKIHMGAAEATTPPMTLTHYLVNVAVNINGHLVLLMFEAPDLHSLNTLIHGKIRFGGGKANKLVPLDITVY